MTQPLVSVLTPAHNEERFIAESIESSLAQDWPVELIVADDGSTDATAEIASGYADRHEQVRLLRLEHRGAAAASNAALEASSGEFICLLDADDTMPPDRVSTQVRFLEEHPDVVGVFGRQELIVEEGAPPPTWVIDPNVILDDEPGAPELSPSAPYHPFFPLGTITTRREAWERAGPFDPALSIAYDMDWILRVWEAGMTLATMDRVVLTRRAHGENFGYDVSAQRRALATVLKKRLDRMRQAG